MGSVMTGCPVVSCLPARARVSVIQQICGEIGLGIRDTQFGGTAVRGGQQPADPARHSILGELGIVQLTQLLQARLLVLDAQHTGSTKMVWNVLAEDLQRALNPGTGRHRRACRPTKIRIVTSRRSRRSSQDNSDSWAPSRVSNAAMASPSRTTTRSMFRTSRAFALIPSRRAAPTKASAASGPGQLTSRAMERPGSVREP